jgi:sarcosine oxidase subunit beta
MTDDRELPATADLVVVGGGVVGAATAFWGARAGLRTVLLERRPQLCTLTTPVATGAFRLQFDNEEELRLVSESVAMFLHFQEVTKQTVYDLAVRQQGYLWLTTDPDRVARQRRVVALQRSWGLEDVEHLTGDEARARFPYVGPNVLAARYRAGDGFLDPRALTFGLATASGARLVTRCEVIGFELSDSAVTGVRTAQGTISAGAVVVACGPFSGRLASRAGVTLPVRAVVRQKVVMPEVSQVPKDAPMTIDEDTGTHWRPALRGAYLLLTDPSTPESPPAEDVPTDHHFAFRLLDPTSADSAARTVPFWREVWRHGAAPWLLQAGQYTMTPDHRPLIGHTPLEGLFVNTGYSGHGIMGSPAGSRLLAEILTGVLHNGDNPFDPGRAFVPRETDVL